MAVYSVTILADSLEQVTALDDRGLDLHRRAARRRPDRGDYAVPAVLGAALVAALHGQDLRGAGALSAAVLLVVGLRMLGVWRDWHAPVAPQHRSRA